MMDINSLLSSSSAESRNPSAALQQHQHDEDHNHVATVAESAAAAAAAAAAATARSNRSLPRQQHLRESTTTTNTIATNASIAATFAPQNQQSPTASSPPVIERRLSYSTTVPYIHGPQKTNSSGSMDTLADLASTQHYSIARHNSNSGIPQTASFRNLDYSELQSGPTASARRAVDAISGGERTPGSATPSGLRKGSLVGDLRMADAAPSVAQSKALAAASMSEEEQAIISNLTDQLAENSYIRAAHIDLVTLLRSGLLRHIQSVDSTRKHRPDPRSYPLLEDLKTARTALTSRFALGETLWLELLKDEALLAKDTDERVAVMELCAKATQEEVGSTAIWRWYCDYVVYLYQKCHEGLLNYDTSRIESDPDLGEIMSRAAWSDEEKAVGQAVFTWNTMLDVWRQAMQASEWHIDSSHLIWDPHMHILLQDLSNKSSPERVQHVRQLYLSRLGQPHRTSQETFDAFSQFISQYDSRSYESTMMAANREKSKGQHLYALRERFEDALQRTVSEGDVGAEHETFVQYLDWETDQSRRKNAPQSSYHLLAALCERANLRFPDVTSFWEDHVDLVMEIDRSQDKILDVASRATRHVPWSGDLWAKRLGALEAAGKPFEELEDVKHHATSTGLLEDETLGSMDDLIKVYMAWCGFLRRRAFSGDAGEDERDMAEVGIGSAMENVMSIGKSKYGASFKGDPYFRIERIFLKFHSQIGNDEEGRRVWLKLSATHGDQFSFWDKFYDWEMLMWGKELGRSQLSGGVRPLPVHATAALQKAVRRPKLDYAEQMIEMYLHHCAQHENIQKLREAQIETRRLSKQIARRRAKEMAEVAAQQQAYEQQYSAGGNPAAAFSTIPGQESLDASKRKYSSISDNEGSSKRLKLDAGDVEMTEPVRPSSSHSYASVKRDRENTTVVVLNLPPHADDAMVLRFFRDCGNIKSVRTVKASSGDSRSATVEFESREDVDVARTKDKKILDNRRLEVKAGSRTTLYLANYPPEADEAAIRSLFADFGEIVQVRFPSLKHNTHRRFCYVQFLNMEEAEAASIQMDNKDLGHHHRLIAKIADPSAKKQREGTQYDGREIHVGQLDYSIDDAELESMFTEYGTIEKVRIPRNAGGKRKGFGFVAFSNAAEADAALAMNMRPFKNRVLQVTIASPSLAGNKTSATTIVDKDKSINGKAGPPADAAGSPMSMDAPANETQGPDYRERSLAIMNLPDTVNDARVRILVEQHAPIKKIVLRPDHQGAIVELEAKVDVGKVAMMLEGHEIEEGRFIRIGEVRDMLKQAPEDKSTASGAKRSTSLFKPSSTTSRPAVRGGRRGGLGFKADRSATSTQKGQTSKSTKSGSDGIASDGKAAGGKSQDDFRALLNKGA